MLLEHNKFSFAQMTSNSSGKTSGSGTAGIYLVFIGGIIGVLATLVAVFTKDAEVAEVLLFASATLTLGAGLLGYRKSIDKTAIENGVPVGKPSSI